MSDNRITITLPADHRWLQLAQASLQHYCNVVGFSEKLYEMCANSTLEACEELVRLSVEHNINEPFELALDSRGETVVIDINYSGRIPLNPQNAVDYELPDSATSFDALNLDTLWLHIIKKRMDRVQFMVRGSRHTLRIIKYRRDEGKEKQAWIMAVRPRLKSNLVLHIDNPDAERSAATLQTKGGGVLRLTESEAFFIRRMDGKASFHSLYMAHIDALGLYSPASLAKLYEKLESMNMLACPAPGAQTSNRSKVLRRILNPDFSIPNADGVATKAYQIFRPLCSQWGVCLLLLIGLSGIIPFIHSYEFFMQSLAGLENIFLTSPWLLFPLYALIIGHIALHELAHAIACKHYGGHIPRIGVMFYLASFIFYCDTTAAWGFARKRDRIMVSLAGPIASFVVFGVSLWVAAAAAGNAPVTKAVLTAFCLTCALSLAMNCNPFIKMDAYYILLDYTGIVNLRTRSFEYLRYHALRALGIESGEQPAATLRERKVFIWYGLLGCAASLVLIAVPFFKLTTLLNAESASGGNLLLPAILAILLITRLGDLTYRKIKSVRNRDYSIQ